VIGDDDMTRNKPVEPETIIGDENELSPLEETITRENRKAGIDIRFTGDPDNIDPLVYDE
jgi:hypothetical protein